MTTLTLDKTALREQYSREGYLLFHKVLDDELILEASDHIDWLQKRNPDLRPELLGHTLMTHDPFWVRLISDPRLLDLAEVFIGSNIALFAAHYISKPPFDGQPVLWHQDGSYWPLEPMEVVTLWLAVDASSPENGCMRVIPGTQTLDLKELQDRKDIANVLNSETPPEFVEANKAVDCILERGGVSIHHPNIIHGSEANLSPMRRAGLTIRYIPTTTKINPRGPLSPENRWPSAFLLRGEAVEGINDYNPYPKYIEGECMPFRGCENWK